MTFGESIQSVMGKYATFDGRASKSEFWWFQLFAMLVGWGAMVVDGAVSDGESFMNLFVSLALALPQLAVAARRLHDTGRSGWWQLLTVTIIGLIPLIIWWAADSAEEANEYGPVPG